MAGRKLVVKTSVSLCSVHEFAVFDWTPPPMRAFALITALEFPEGKYMNQVSPVDCPRITTRARVDQDAPSCPRGKVASGSFSFPSSLPPAAASKWLGFDQEQTLTGRRDCIPQNTSHEGNANQQNKLWRVRTMPSVRCPRKYNIGPADELVPPCQCSPGTWDIRRQLRPAGSPSDNPR